MIGYMLFFTPETLPQKRQHRALPEEFVRLERRRTGANGRAGPTRATQPDTGD
jgi:hypothetical protein